MTYRELLMLYKSGKLDEQSRKKVEADIERQDAISDYLFNESDIPDLDICKKEKENYDDAKDDTDEKFIRMIHRSIRRVFIKMGLIVGAVILAVLLCVIFLLPSAVSLFYYDPTETVGQNAQTGSETNRMSLDLSVYTEMFLPGCYRNKVIADSEGYGKYTISIPQVASYTGTFTDLTGTLERGKLTLYNTNVLKAPAGNAFLLPAGTPGATASLQDEGGALIGPAGTKEEAYAALDALDEDEWYLAYISLADITDYETFYRWLEEKKLTYGSLWCGVYTEDENGVFLTGSDAVGFSPQLAGECIDWDRNAYPKLSLLDNAAEDGHWDDAENGEAMQTHFISMLRYLKEHNDIMTIMNAGALDFDGMIRSIEENGLRIYGFAVGAKKDTLLCLSKDPAVSYIYTNAMI
ncbi:anti-sigma factor C-terminal domain-containing protein [Christensenella massiliensis]|uniref:Anti-sigma factor C-terminal domain-containing protein n=1 Tax=Christensenella massiliensis TaxID=1805714 RepID=A0AAU8A9A3_9FIRM